MKWLSALWLAAALAAPSRPLQIVFVPDSDQFKAAAEEYETLWKREGARITETMEAASGLKFEDREVKAIVLEVSSDSGYKDPRQVRYQAALRPDMWISFDFKLLLAHRSSPQSAPNSDFATWHDEAV